MNELERTGLAGMRNCWITGGTAAELAPPAWKEMVGQGQPDDRERLLLALAGQAFDVALRPAAPKALVARAPLPRLALPTLAGPVRPLFRMAVKQAGDAGARLRVAALTASRGFVAHPLDWMPAATDLDAPAVYAPWVDWQAKSSATSDPALQELDAENWEAFSPATRRALLARMRQADPAAARTLLEARAVAEPAEARVALVELLHVGLSVADAPFLEGLAGDRSAKVRKLAGRLLARIGRREAGAEADAAAAELAGFIEQSRTGVIRRRTVYAPLKLKSAAQMQRRSELFETCQLIDLAAKLGANEGDLIAGWQLGAEDRVDIELARMTAGSGSERAAMQLADMLISAGATAPLLALLPRLDEPRRRSFVRAVLAGEPRFLHLLTNAGVELELGRTERDEIMTSRAYRQTRSALATGDDGEQRFALSHLAMFGLLADVEAAQAILSDLVAAGVAPADSALALLRLNAALTACPGDRA